MRRSGLWLGRLLASLLILVLAPLLFAATQSSATAALGPALITNAHDGFAGRQVLSVRATRDVAESLPSTPSGHAAPSRSEENPRFAAEAGGELAPAVVGEGMAPRVIPYAEQNGLTYYKGLANPENYSQDELLAHNQAQIQAWKAEGRSVIDIGPDPLRPGYPGPTSPNYAMELQELQRYGGYSRVWINEPERYLMATAH